MGIPHPHLVRGRFADSQSTVLHVVAMISPLVAALVVLAVVAEAASTKYEDDYKEDYHYKRDSYKEDEYDHDYKMKKHVTYARTYKHEPEYYEEEYHEPSKKYGSHGKSYGKSYGSYRHKRQAGEESREGNQFPGLFTPFGGSLSGGFPAVGGGGLTSPGVATGLEGCSLSCDAPAGEAREGTQFGGFGGGLLAQPKLLDKIGNICIVEMQC